MKPSFNKGKYVIKPVHSGSGEKLGNEEKEGIK